MPLTVSPQVVFAGLNVQSSLQHGPPSHFSLFSLLPFPHTASLSVSVSVLVSSVLNGLIFLFLLEIRLLLIFLIEGSGRVDGDSEDISEDVIVSICSAFSKSGGVN